MAESPHQATAAILGAGVIGQGWVARFLLHGWNVNVFDSAPEAEHKVRTVVERARKALDALYTTPLPAPGELNFAASGREAIEQADWVQESIPESLDTKRQLYQEIQDHLPASAILASSTSGFKPTELAQDLACAEQMLVCHPFNPVYLLPVVEVVAGAETGTTYLTRAERILEGIGMKPLRVRREIDAHIADRLLEALWREALWLVKDDVATTQEIDDVMRLGFGLRWAQMGLFETYRIAGGEAGMKHFLEQFGPALSWPWSKLTDVPELTEELIAKIASQSDQQSGHMSIAQLETQRDDNLVAIMNALKATDSGAGEWINTLDQRRKDSI